MVKAIGRKRKAPRAAGSISNQRLVKAWATGAFGRAAPVPMALVRTGGRMPVGAGELKNIDTTSIAYPAVGAFSGYVTLLNGCVQGTTANNRIGRLIKMKSLYLCLPMSLQPTSTGSAHARVLVVYDRQTNTSALTASSVLEVDELSSPISLQNQRRYRVLYDRTIQCIGTAGPQSIVFKKFIKLGQSVEFNAGNAGTVGDIQTGSLYVIVYVDGVGVAAVNVGGAGTTAYARVMFSDS